MAGSDDPNISNARSELKTPEAIKAYIDSEIEKLAPRLAHKKKWRNAWRSASPITRGSFIVTVAVGLATIVYSLVAIFQLKEMARTTKATESSVRIAGEALSEAGKSSVESSKQFQAQLKHFDAGLGKTGELAKHAAEQSLAANESASAAKAAATSASIAIRPWLKIKTVELRPGVGPIHTLSYHWPLTGAVVPPQLQLKLTALNVGHTPAQNVETFSLLFFGKFESSEWHALIIAKERRVCDSFMKIRPRAIGAVVFPDDPYENHMGASGLIPSEAITHDSQSGVDYSSAALILCVNYEGAGGVKYQTRAWYGLYRDRQIVMPINIDTDADHLQLIREANGDESR